MNIANRKVILTKILCYFHIPHCCLAILEFRVSDLDPVSTISCLTSSLFDIHVQVEVKMHSSQNVPGN